MNKKFSELPVREKIEVVVCGLFWTAVMGLATGLIPF